MLSFQAETHCYRFNGAVVPSVTQVLSMLVDFRGVSQTVLDAKAVLGTAVHKMVALDCVDDLEEQGLDEALIPFLAAWRTFKAEAGFVHESIEQMVLHPLHLFAGTYDLVGRLRIGKKCLIDLKIANPAPTHALQTAGYREAYNVNQQFKRDHAQERYALYLKDNGRYSLVTHNEKSDFQVFLSALAIFRWRARNA